VVILIGLISNWSVIGWIAVGRGWIDTGGIRRREAEGEAVAEVAAEAVAEAVAEVVAEVAAEAAAEVVWFIGRRRSAKDY
jgi:predicted NBD/HSP70 family sugar kinase